MSKFASLAVLAGALTACSSTTDVEAQDTFSFAQGAIFRYAPGLEQPGRVGLEVSGDRHEADDDIPRDTGTIVWQGTTFPQGPGMLEADWQQEAINLGIFFEQDRSPRTEFYISTGFRYADVELDLEGTEGSVDQAGVYGAIDFTYWFDPFLGFFVRGMLAWSEPLEDLGFIDDDGEEELREGRAELGIAVGLGAAALRLGWRSSSTDMEIPSGSDLELDSAGPFIALAIRL